MADGNKVRLRPEATLCGMYPELMDQVGTLNDGFDENGVELLSVQFLKPAKILLLNVLAADIETVD